VTVPPIPQQVTTEVGYVRTGQSWWGQLDAEPTAELRWPHSIGVFDAMRTQDAQVGSVLRAVTLPVRRTTWRLDPNGARDEVVAFVADNLDLPIAGVMDTPPPLTRRGRGRFSWAEHLRLALLMLPFGHQFFEQVYVIDAAGRARLRKLAQRPSPSIQAIDVADDGGLVAIRQRPPGLSADPVEIPVDRLVAYVHDREGGSWLGRSLLRPGFKNWLIKDRLLRVQAQSIERNGLGIPVYTGAEGEGDLSKGLAIAQSYRAGDTAGAAIPNGAELRLRGVEGQIPDATAAVRYHDEQIARAVLAHFLNLGTQTGSWALGSTFADFFTMSLQTVADTVADVATHHIVEDLVDLNWGEDEPAPRVVCDDIGNQRVLTAEAIRVLVDTGVIRTDRDLEEFVRSVFGLPPKQFPAPPPSDTPPGGPAEVAPAAGVPVAASRRRDAPGRPVQFDQIPLLDVL
jgi:hypothetical protein